MPTALGRWVSSFSGGSVLLVAAKDRSRSSSDSVVLQTQVDMLFSLTPQALWVLFAEDAVAHIRTTLHFPFLNIINIYTQIYKTNLQNNTILPLQELKKKRNKNNDIAM